MAGTDGGYRRSEEIAEEISEIRNRMGDTLSEIERRLGGGRGTEGAKAFVSEFADLGIGAEARETFDRITAAVRRNPLPAVLVGIGAVWLAYEIFQLRGARGGPMARREAVDLLSTLTGVARQGAKALRQASVTVAEGPVREALRLASIDRGHTAHLLQMELQALGIDAVHGLAPTGDWLPSWRRVEEVTEAGNTAAILEAVAVAEDETLHRFRAALRRPLPNPMRVVIGSRVHEVEGTRARLLSLSEAVG